MTAPQWFLQSAQFNNKCRTKSARRGKRASTGIMNGEGIPEGNFWQESRSLINAIPYHMGNSRPFVPSSFLIGTRYELGFRFPSGWGLFQKGRCAPFIEFSGRRDAVLVNCINRYETQIKKHLILQNRYFGTKDKL